MQEKAETEHLVDKHVETELKLSQQAKKLLATSDVVSKDLNLLHDKVDRGRKVQETNEQVIEYELFYGVLVLFFIIFVLFYKLELR